MGNDHPEQPARLHQISDQLISSGLEYVVHFANAQKIDTHTVKLAHESDFVDRVIDSAPQKEGERVFIDEDTVLMSKSLDAVLHSAGAVKDAVDLIQAGKTQSAFCSVRPPGHHAGYANSSGFCVFNNVAIGAKYALDVIGLKRVAIIDFDVHHGNGTQDIVESDERIMFCSSFQHPFYPFSGSEPSREGILNVPIAAGTAGEEYRQLVKHWFDALDAFKPELIFISAGFDAHAEDEMGYLRLVENDYVWLTEQIKTIADKHCKGHIISVLEGGYALSALARSVVAHLKTLAG
ncbi:MAG: acetoin utilization deacetylase AcuC-like enzyme [Alphaproteobacteria bacterium]|jgi:acetoin utilization deacetylase AcuC-like enzyme